MKIQGYWHDILHPKVFNQ